MCYWLATHQCHFQYINKLFKKKSYKRMCAYNVNMWMSRIRVKALFSLKQFIYLLKNKTFSYFVIIFFFFLKFVISITISLCVVIILFVRYYRFRIIYSKYVIILNIVLKIRNRTLCVKIIYTTKIVQKSFIDNISLSD